MSGCSVVAIVAAYNEADVVGAVVRDLIAQGVSVYFLDDGSTDGTVDAVAPLIGRGVLKVEMLGAAGSTPERFEWQRILRRKEQLAATLDADWFIHHDADEFRESPWPGVSLGEGIALVDRLGFNAIDALSLDFWPTHEHFQPGTDVREAFRHYAPGAPHDRRQIRCWKKTEHPVDLASTGGHEAQFPGRRVFPIRFLQRHYPIRGQRHGERKVLQERRRRFSPSERALGWHVQYDQTSDSFLRDPATLTPFDADTIRFQLAVEHRGVEKLNETVRDLRTALESTQAALAETRASLAAEQSAVVSARARIDELERAVASETAAHRAATTAHQRQRAEWSQSEAELERQLNAMARDFDGHRRALADAKRQLGDVERSWSWRLSAPARFVLRLLTGR